jgi:hypothetical protein
MVSSILAVYSKNTRGLTCENLRQVPHELALRMAVSVKNELPQDLRLQLEVGIFKELIGMNPGNTCQICFCTDYGDCWTCRKCSGMKAPFVLCSQCYSGLCDGIVAHFPGDETHVFTEVETDTVLTVLPSKFKEKRPESTVIARSRPSSSDDMSRTETAECFEQPESPKITHWSRLQEENEQDPLLNERDRTASRQNRVQIAEDGVHLEMMHQVMQTATAENVNAAVEGLSRARHSAGMAAGGAKMERTRGDGVGKSSRQEDSDFGAPPPPPSTSHSPSRFVPAIPTPADISYALQIQQISPLNANDDEETESRALSSMALMLVVKDEELQECKERFEQADSAHSSFTQANTEGSKTPLTSAPSASPIPSLCVLCKECFSGNQGCKELLSGAFYKRGEASFCTKCFPVVCAVQASPQTAVSASAEGTTVVEHQDEDTLSDLADAHFIPVVIPVATSVKESAEAEAQHGPVSWSEVRVDSKQGGEGAEEQGIEVTIGPIPLQSKDGIVETSHREDDDFKVALQPVTSVSLKP